MQLFEAIRRQSMDDVVIALRDTTNLDDVNEYGETPLILAAATGQLDVVELLLDKGADPVFQTYTTAMIEAAENGHVTVVRKLLDVAPRLTTLTDELGETPLEAAFRSRQKLVVQLLLDRCAMSTSQQRKLTRIAVEIADTELAELLTPFLPQKAQKKVADSLARHQALCPKVITVAPVLVIDAIREHDMDRLTDYLRRGTDTSASYLGILPLHQAIATGWFDGVRLLTDHDANVNARNRLGKSVLDIACSNNHPEILDYLWSRCSQQIREEALRDHGDRIAQLRRTRSQ